MLSITSFYAGLLTLIYIVLSARVILYRRDKALSLGDEGDRELLTRMRAQANCAEYVPLSLLLLALIELAGAPGIATHGLALLLLAGRVVHAVGFAGYPPKLRLRVIGTALTLTMLALSATGLVLHSLI